MAFFRPLTGALADDFAESFAFGARFSNSNPTLPSLPRTKNAENFRREGDFVIRTRIDSFETGEIKAYGNGLYLPVRMVGAASIDYRPAK